MLIGARPRKLKNFEAAECPPPIARRPNSTVAAILRSTVIGSQSVKGREGFKPIILFIWCHVRSASFTIFVRVEGVLVSSVARISNVARVSSIARISSVAMVSRVARVARVATVARVSSVARVARVARVSSIARVSAGGSSNCLRTLRDSCLLFPFLIMYTLHDGLVMGPIQITANINSKQLYKL